MHYPDRLKLRETVTANKTKCQLPHTFPMVRCVKQRKQFSATASRMFLVSVHQYLDSPLDRIFFCFYRQRIQKHVGPEKSCKFSYELKRRECLLYSICSYNTACCKYADHQSEGDAFCILGSSGLSAPPDVIPQTDNIRYIHNPNPNSKSKVEVKHQTLPSWLTSQTLPTTASALPGISAAPCCKIALPS